MQFYEVHYLLKNFMIKLSFVSKGKKEKSEFNVYVWLFFIASNL